MKLTVFFSWQSPTKNQGFNNKEFLVECINSALKQIADKGRLKGVFFEFWEGLGKEAGSPDVAQKMFEQIDNCDIFIGDFTIQRPPYSCIEKGWAKLWNKQLQRREPNSNVIAEFSRALKNSDEFESQCILVLNTVNGDPDKEPELIPFDLRGRRHPITFYMDKHTVQSDIKNRLVQQLEKALYDSAIVALENKGKKYEPFVGWKKLSQDKNLAYEYVSNSNLEGKRNLILNNKGIIRLIGLSGMGKTRLILETFRKSDKNLHFLYSNCNEYQKKDVYGKLKKLFREYKEAIIILDNCDKDFLEDVMELKRSENANNDIISIHNDPSEKTIAGTNQIVLELDDDKGVVEGILSKIPNLTDDQRKRIADFASNNPKMAELLYRGIQDGRQLGQLDDNSLMSKLLQYEPNSNERVIMQSLSLFQYVGYKNDKRREFESIIKTKSITSLDYNNESVLLQDSDSVVNKNLDRGILELRGRLIGVRPIPLSLKLVEEWLDGRTEESMLSVINDIASMKDARSLMNEFYKQFSNLGYYDKAKIMLDKLLAPSSPFESAEVINTELGSQLFRTFVEVNPVAVSKLLNRVLSPLSVDELKQISVGRRNLVWTVEKLCFDPRTFAEGAFIMMRLGVAENENWSNNASSDFASLFPIILPATSVDLNTRLSFLKENIRSEENKPLIVRALSSALKMGQFVYFSGAEKQGTKELTNYYPKSNDEIASYISECLNLIREEILAKGNQKEACIKILEDNTASLVKHGFGKLILPVVDEVACALNNDWERMRDNLILFKSSIVSTVSSEDKEQYEHILDKLTKHDIVTDFRLVEKESYSLWGTKFDERQQINQKKYEVLADRFVAHYNIGDLEGLMCSENILIHPFGNRIYDGLGEDRRIQFVKDCIRILNNNPEAKPTILLDFFSNIRDDETKSFVEVVNNIQDKQVAFELYGRMRIIPTMLLFSNLTKWVKEGEAKVDAFNRYWINLPFEVQNIENTIDVVKEILSFEGGLAVVMRFALFLTIHKNGSEKKLITLLKDAIMSYKNGGTDLLHVDFLPQVANKLLDNYHLEDLASFINTQLIEYLNDSNNIVVNNYDVTELYDTLIREYFLVIWPALSKTIVSENIMLYLHIKEVVGSSMANEGAGVLFKEDHHEAFKSLCKDYPSIAPARIIDMAPPYNEKGELSQLVIDILKIYGDQNDVLSQLEAKLNSFSSEGSVIPQLNSQQEALGALIHFPVEKVSKWAKAQISSLDLQIKRWRTIEEEPMM